MANANPFTAQRPTEVPSEKDGAAFARFGVIYGCEALWDLIEDLPNKAEAKLAQRRLEEAVFWAVRAAGAR